MLRKLIVLSVILLAFGGATSAAYASTKSETIRAIRAVWPDNYENQAIGVAGCETGYTWSPRAVSRDGLYWGVFQQGAWQRGSYGFAWNAWTQASSAWRAFQANGYSWTRNSQWPVCGRPYG